MVFLRLRGATSTVRTCLNQGMAFSVPRTGSLLIADWLRALRQDVVKIGYREKVHHS